MRQALVLSIGLVVAACGGASKKQDSAHGGGVLDGKAYVRTADGAYVFKDPLGEVGSNKGYRLTFTAEDGGSVTLVSHADRALAGGLALTFRRSGAELAFSMTAGETTTEPKTLAGVDVAGAVSLAVDVHNEESPAHVVVWTAAQEEPSLENALYESERDGDAPGNGTDALWGLRFEKATVTGVDVGEPLVTKDEE
jgi:hypothetical protein